MVILYLIKKIKILQNNLKALWRKNKNQIQIQILYFKMKPKNMLKITMVSFYF